MFIKAFQFFFFRPPDYRAFVNIIATYGRSVYALVFGLFTARWVLEALGRVDFGQYGLVGGLTVFIGFFNTLFSVATSRFVCDTNRL